MNCKFKIGDVFGNVTILKLLERNKDGAMLALFQCICGNTFTSTITAVKSRHSKGSTVSCGCKRKKDMTGQRFGKLVVVEDTGERLYTSPVWKVLCDCGEYSYVTRATLTHKKSKGTRPKCCNFADSSRIGRIFRNMHKRCLNDPLKNSDYKNYASRGITVCPEWHSFDNFKKWALSSGYKDTLSLDRIDVNGSYEPDNCRWATIEVQSLNKRRQSKSGYPNVWEDLTRRKDRRWVAEFKFNKEHYLKGGFATPKEAFEHVLEVKKQMKERSRTLLDNL